ncbi:hypothetical protein B0T26DRAFT_671889 [Lasiosphaeria miniovina]|uniref:Uncharacterized protein n=1 Tax=Lasiosphaeria miniovina TaxID=1954250 RepID=A0AA40B414_9PEZI|nr:uncharacterized protein B0T26DRAFT_671889 [Lasiosphaeria miniovina]KAK0727194.1 hypothetical protein B0T26DRAFT_671889 [Lasiosphaeria miniovina]
MSSKRLPAYPAYLLGIPELHQASVAQRMAWAAERVTKRKEDIAYSLVGLFGVNMPMIYGEGDKAFPIPGRFLASAPSDFVNCGGITSPEQLSGHLFDKSASGLELTDVEPKARWHKERALIEAAINDPESDHSI